ncbi:zinc finger protein 91-like isoform X2 [Ptychodera flava]
MFCTYTNMAEMEIGSERRKTKNPVRLIVSKNSLQCEVCGYEAASAASLKIHIRIHTGEKPYKCSQCDYASAKKCNLTRHKEKHSNARVECEICDAQIKSSYVHKHKRLHFNVSDHSMEYGETDSDSAVQAQQNSPKPSSFAAHSKSCSRDDIGTRDSIEVLETSRLDLRLLCNTVLTLLQRHSLNCEQCGPVLQNQMHVSIPETLSPSEKNTLPISQGENHKGMIQGLSNSRFLSQGNMHKEHIPLAHQEVSNKKHCGLENSQIFVIDNHNVTQTFQSPTVCNNVHDMNIIDNNSDNNYLHQSEFGNKIKEEMHYQISESTVGSQTGGTAKGTREADGFNHGQECKTGIVAKESALKKIKTQAIHKEARETISLKNDNWCLNGQQDSILERTFSHVCEHIPNSDDIKNKEQVIKYKCKYCLYCASSEVDLSQHLNSHTIHDSGDVVMCSLCPFFPYNQDQLNSHREITHKTKTALAERRKDHECLFCGKIFHSTCKLKEHSKRMHRRQKLKCNQCGYTSDRYSNMKRHRESHGGHHDKVVKCSLCDAAFNSKSALGAHERTHSDILDKHSVHKCTTCGKKFRHKIDHTFHMFIHFQKKLFQCPELSCSTESTSVADLKIHYFQEHSNTSHSNMQNDSKD